MAPRLKGGTNGHTRAHVTQGNRKSSPHHLELSSPGAPLTRPAAPRTAAGMGAATHRCTGRAGSRRERVRRGRGGSPEHKLPARPSHPGLPGAGATNTYKQMEARGPAQDEAASGEEFTELALSQLAVAPAACSAGTQPQVPTHLQVPPHLPRSCHAGRPSERPPASELSHISSPLHGEIQV